MEIYTHDSWCAGERGDIFDRLMCNCRPYEQLELDLWVEERLTPYDCMVASPKYYRLRDLVDDRPEGCVITKDFSSLEIIVGYKV